jgi:hypothetical protein
MPAGSDRPAQPAGRPPVEVPALPARFRPLGVVVASLLFGVALVVVVVAVWLALPEETQEGFTWPQRGTVALMVLIGAVIAYAISRCRVDADEDGILVVNGFRSHRHTWEEVVGVTLRPGNPWAVLDLSDGTSRSAMGIQGSDGRRAVRQARQLRALVEAHAGVEPDRRP